MALLFSPPLLPQYNGSVEAGNGSRKTHLRQEALRQGRPDLWTSQDVAAAVAAANALSHPHGPYAPTPDAAWAAAGPVTEPERCHFLKTLDDARREVRMEREWTSEDLTDRAARASGPAIRQTLARRGYLCLRRTMMKSRFQGILAAAFLCLYSVVRGEVIYERTLTDAEKEKYVLSGDSSYFPEGMTYDQAKELLLQQAKQRDPHGQVVKVVLERDLKQGGRPICTGTYLGQRKDFLAAQKKWQEEGPKRLGIGEKITGLKHVSTGAFVQQFCDFYFDDVRFIYMVMEDFWEPKQGASTATIWETSEHTIPPHELMRQLVENPCRVEAMDFGRVVVSEPAHGRGRRGGAVCMAWLSGEHIAVYIRSQGEVPKELLQLYGKTYPSRLPKDFAIDKTAWGREEMELWLGRMGRFLEGKDWREHDDPISGTDWFANYLTEIRFYIWVPSLEARNWTGENPKGAERKAIYGELVAWWGKYKDKTYWDEGLLTKGRLVAQGQTPKDIAEIEKEKQARAMEAMLNVPLTDNDIQNLENKLKTFLNSELERKAAELAGNFPDGKARVTLARPSEDKWVLTCPGPTDGATVTRTYTVFKAKSQNDKAKPLKALVTNQTVDSATPERKTETKRTFVFDRVAGQWIPAD